MTELETFRRQKDRYFKTGPDSPIPHEQRAEFAGLVYYPENAGLRLVVQAEEFAESEPNISRINDCVSACLWYNAPWTWQGPALYHCTHGAHLPTAMLVFLRYPSLPAHPQEHGR